MKSSTNRTLVRATGLALLSTTMSCSQRPDWDAAHKRYLMMIENKASRAELCAASKRDAALALNAVDEGEYKSWKQMEREDCGERSRAVAV